MAESAVFLDRDGTILEDPGYLDDSEGLVIYGEALDAVQIIREVGMRVVVVTNQSGLARGLFSEKALHDIHDSLREAFLHQGSPLDAIYFCPHHPQADVAQYRRHCNCRKPEPGLLRRAAEALGIDLARSYMIGDKISDIVAGHRAGCKAAILVETGAGAQSVKELEKRKPSRSASTGRPSMGQPEHVASDILQAAQWILEDRRVPRDDD